MHIYIYIHIRKLFHIQYNICTCFHLNIRYHKILATAHLTYKLLSGWKKRLLQQWHGLIDPQLLCNWMMWCSKTMKLKSSVNHQKHVDYVCIYIYYITLLYICIYFRSIISPHVSQSTFLTTSKLWRPPFQLRTLQENTLEGACAMMPDFFGSHLLHPRKWVCHIP